MPPIKRKRVQAFTAPKDKNTKAILKRNATSSPLLTIPLELRRKIWGYVLGNRLIHITVEERWAYHRAFRNTRIGIEFTTARLYNTVCQSSTTEREAYELSKTLKNIQTRTSMTAEEAEVLLCGDRHAACLAALKEPNIHNSAKHVPPHGLTVNVLTLCRQVYVDANPILWGTNTWSFHQSNAWRAWLGHRNAVQRRLLRKIHLWRDVIVDFTPKVLLSTLKGLEELNVDISTFYQFRLDRCDSIFPAEKITVIAYDMCTASQLNTDRESTSFEERIATAEKFRTKLIKLQTEATRKKQKKASAKLLITGKNGTNSTGNVDGEIEKREAGENKN